MARISKIFLLNKRRERQIAAEEVQRKAAVMTLLYLAAHRKTLRIIVPSFVSDFSRLFSFKPYRAASKRTDGACYLCRYSKRNYEFQVDEEWIGILRLSLEDGVVEKLKTTVPKAEDDYKRKETIENMVCKWRGEGENEKLSESNKRWKRERERKDKRIYGRRKRKRECQEEGNKRGY